MLTDSFYHEVVRKTFVVVQEVVFDDVAAIAETENEIGVAEICIVLHEMPHDGPVADLHHRLGNRL